MLKAKFLIATGMVACLALGMALTTRAAGAPITSGIVGWWLFNQTSGVVADDSAALYNGDATNNGTLTGATVFVDDATRGQVLNVYGVSGAVDMPVSPLFQPVTGTISVWVKPTLLEVSDIVSEETTFRPVCKLSGTLYAYALHIDTKGSPQAIIANDNPKTCKKSNSIVASGIANSVKANVWTHLAMVWNGTDVLIYVNGKQTGTEAYTPDPTIGLSYTPNQPVKVVSSSLMNGSQEYDGEISDLRIYSRALSATEINDIAVNQQ